MTIMQDGVRLRPSTREPLSPGGDAPCPAVLALLRDVLQSLDAGGIRCCYWKSSLRVGAVLAGESDLDLLIARDDQHAARQVLLTRGLKAFAEATGRAIPAVESFLGYDRASGRIVHVHAHFRLVLGPRLLRHYQLGAEDEILAHSVRHPVLPLRVLDPDTEAVLLVLRACLELRRDDPVTLRHWAAACTKIAADRAALVPVVDPVAVRQRATALLGEALADGLVDALLANRPLEGQYRLRRRIRRALAPCRGFNTVEAFLRGSWRTCAWIAGGLNREYLWLPRPWGRRVPGGGIVVAVLGVDGSGKTTVVRALRNWLVAEVDTLPMYFGTGDGRPSVVLLPFKLLVPLIARMLRTRPDSSSHGRVTGQAPGPLYSLLLTVWAAIVAMEKRRKLLSAHRAASRGMVVITDRYPQNQIASFNDGPLLPRLRWVPRWLRRAEARAYALGDCLAPDLVLKLEAPIERLLQREPMMDPDVVRARADRLRQLVFPGARMVSIDAAGELEDVIEVAKSEIWRLL